jgi:hypothetical protein
MFLLLYCDLALIVDSSYKSINCAKRPTNLALLILTPISAFGINPYMQSSVPSPTNITLMTSSSMSLPLNPSPCKHQQL